ncbi:MAG: ComF family protein, partial [Gammaproteobacteria bacterium]|nr:ComF family protein [Gammaproteobacteria bacterium]
SKTLCLQCLDSFRDSSPRPEILIPVPLHCARLFERGYNQADEIAAVWSQTFGIPVDRHALTRLRATPSQSGLSAAQRANNVRQAFAYRPKRKYRHVALVDDIVTTGSTVTEITKTLHRAGVEYVEVWALARVYRK